jgi:predicted RNase H-like HicB family nuclease
MKYLIVVEKTNTGFSAYLPDVDGCVATGKTKEKVMITMQEALEFHFEGLQLSKQSLPKPQAYSDYVEVPVTA